MSKTKPGIKKYSDIKKINDRLCRIANVLLLNGSFIESPGLLNGKMGIAIFLYNYARYTDNRIFIDFAGELIDEIYEEINSNTPVSFEDGLTGIGWGIEYLVRNKFVQADTDEVLTDIDNAIYRVRLQSPVLISNGKDIFGYGLYYLMRLYGKEADDDNLDTLIKKYHLIYLTDECERILMQKLYSRYRIDSLEVNSVISFIWFLLEIERLRIFQVKARKILSSAPEYVIDGLQSSGDYAGKRLLQRLTKETINVVKDQCTRDLLIDLLKKNDNDDSLMQISDESLVAGFIKNTWQRLIYFPLIDSNGNKISFDRIFSIIDDENNWTQRLNSINKDNLGLTGLAGLGLGLLMLQNELDRAEGREL